MSFRLANDTPDRLLIPEKLYRRASEIETLLAAFDRIVAAVGGVGARFRMLRHRQSSVVNELHKPLVPPPLLRQAVRPVQARHPICHFGSGFSGLIRQLLSQSKRSWVNECLSGGARCGQTSSLWIWFRN